MFRFDVICGLLSVYKGQQVTVKTPTGEEETGILQGYRVTSGTCILFVENGSLPTLAGDVVVVYDNDPRRPGVVVIVTASGGEITIKLP